MKLFDVYSLFNITPVQASGSYVWDNKGTKYLDFYGGHAVISIGHSHPHYVQKLSEQLQQIGFYSNSVQIPQQQALANKLGALSGYNDYQLFLCNSGAEANENAFKLASFHTGRKKIVSFTNSFHGRTSAAVAATDDPSIVAPINRTDNIIFCSFGDTAQLQQIFAKEGHDIAAVIIEGIQGVGGVQVPSADFLETIQSITQQYGALMICDEIQSGYGRCGRFFAHQYAQVKPDIITVAKGMGNGFPVAGVLINPIIQPKISMLGTTFGGNYLACAAANAVLDVMEQENLIANAATIGNYLIGELKNIEGIAEVRGLGLMIGIELFEPSSTVRNALLSEHHIFTGSASQKNTLRLLPALTITKQEADLFLSAFEQTFKKYRSNTVSNTASASQSLSIV